MKPNSDERTNIGYWRKKVKFWAKVMGLPYRFHTQLLCKPDATWVARTHHDHSHPDVLIEINLPSVIRRQFEVKGDETHWPTTDPDELILHELSHTVVNRYRNACMEAARGVTSRLAGGNPNTSQREFDWVCETTKESEEELVDAIACIAVRAYKTGGKKV